MHTLHKFIVTPLVAVISVGGALFTPLSALAECDTTTAAAKLAEATIALTSGDNVTAAQRIAEAAAALSTCQRTNIVEGSRIVTTTNLRVRATPSSTGQTVGIAPVGTRGTIACSKSGGFTCPFIQGSYKWWRIDYDNGMSGWSVEQTGDATGYIVLYTGGVSAPPPPPPPPGAPPPPPPYDDEVSACTIYGPSTVRTGEPFTISWRVATGVTALGLDSHSGLNNLSLASVPSDLRASLVQGKIPMCPPLSSDKCQLAGISFKNAGTASLTLAAVDSEAHTKTCTHTITASATGSVPPPSPPPPPPPGSLSAPPASTNPNPYTGKFGVLLMPRMNIIEGKKQEVWFLGNGYQNCQLHRIEGPLGKQRSAAVITTAKAGSSLIKVGFAVDAFDPLSNVKPEEVNFICFDGADPRLVFSGGLSMKLTASGILAYSSQMLAQQLPFYGTAGAPIGGTSTPGPRFSFQAEVEGKTTTVTGDPANPTVVSFSSSAAGNPSAGKVKITWNAPSVYTACVATKNGVVAGKGQISAVGHVGTPIFAGSFFTGSSGSITVNFADFLRTKPGVQRIASASHDFGLRYIICSGPTVAPSVTAVRVTIPGSAANALPGPTQVREKRREELAKQLLQAVQGSGQMQQLLGGALGGGGAGR